MEIVSDKKETIFRKDFEGKPRYQISLVKKKKDNSYEYGYIQVRFKQDITLKNNTKIMIKEAWLSFTTYENKTYPYIFINDFSIVDEGEMQTELKTKTYSDFGEQIKITDEDLPF